MRYWYLYFFLLAPNLAFADMNPIHLKTLLNICDTARQTSDIGTVANIANQIRNSDRPSDKFLSDQYDQCLWSASGENGGPPNLSDLLKRIEKSATQLENDCRDLLETAPTVAISNAICKSIFLR